MVLRAQFISDFISWLLCCHLCGGFDLAFHILSASDVLYTGKWWCWAASGSQRLGSHHGGFAAVVSTAVVILVALQRSSLQRLASQWQAS